MKQKVFRTYKNPVFFLLQSLIALFRIPIFLWKNKHPRSILYFTVFHPWNGLFMFFGRLLGYKSVLTIHDFITHLGERSWLIEAIQQYQIKKADKLIFLSKYVRNQALSWSENLGHKCHIINHPIPRDIEANNMGFNTRPNILVLGRMKDYKGIDMLSNAIYGLEYNQLTLAGLGSFNYSYEIERLQIEDAWVSTERLNELLSEHEILILPYKEASQSGVLTLGIAAEMVILATNVGALPEQASSNAVLFSDPDSNDLRDKLIQLTSDNVLYNNLKFNIKTLKEETNAKVAAQIEDFFNKL